MICPDVVVTKFGEVPLCDYLYLDANCSIFKKRFVFDDYLKFHLEEVVFLTPKGERYYALRYCWGDRGVNDKTFVFDNSDDLRVKVKAALYEYLFKLG